MGTAGYMKPCSVVVLACTVACTLQARPGIQESAEPKGPPTAVALAAPSSPLTQGPTARPASEFASLYPPHDPAATYPVIRTWEQLLDFRPYPYLRPLAAPQSSAMDGLYAKLDPREPQWWRCARCADFMLAGGIWKILLFQGRMLLYYEVTGFSSVASFAVDGDRVELFNDPHCPYDVGGYTWRIQDRALLLFEQRDECAIHLRAANLTEQPWVSCQPPNSEAAVSDHWIRPAGCD